MDLSFSMFNFLCTHSNARATHIVCAPQAPFSCGIMYSDCPWIQLPSVCIYVFCQFHFAVDSWSWNRIKKSEVENWWPFLLAFSRCFHDDSSPSPPSPIISNVLKHKFVSIIFSLVFRRLSIHSLFFYPSFIYFSLFPFMLLTREIVNVTDKNMVNISQTFSFFTLKRTKKKKKFIISTQYAINSISIHKTA